MRVWLDDTRPMPTPYERGPAMLSSIKDCKHGHCRFHFPQFRAFTEANFTATLKKVLSEDYENKVYYHSSYPNWRELNEEYRRILNMMGKGREEFVAACEAFMLLQTNHTSFIRHNLYLDLQGGVAEFIQCCG